MLQIVSIQAGNVILESNKFKVNLKNKLKLKKYVKILINSQKVSHHQSHNTHLHISSCK